MSRKTLIKPFIFILFLLTTIFTARALYRIITTTAPDFSVLWLTTQDLPAGANPYLNPEIFTGLGYPPNTLLFYLPFLPFSYSLAQAIFIILSVVAIAAGVFLSLKLAINKVPWHIFFLALSLTFLSFPTKFTLGMGQNNAIALLLLLLGFYFYQQKKKVLSGILIGATIALKTIFGFFLLFFLLKREWRILLWVALPLLVSILLVAGISDLNLYNYWIKEVIPPLLNLEGREIYFNQGIMGFVSRLTGDLVLRRFFGSILSLTAVVLASFFALRKEGEKLQFSLSIIVLLLIDTLSWQHHFIWLIFPFVLLTSWAIKKEKPQQLLLIGLSYFLVSYNFRNPEQFTGLLGALILSNTFYGAVILFLINLYALKASSYKGIN